MPAYRCAFVECRAVKGPPEAAAERSEQSE